MEEIMFLATVDSQFGKAILVTVLVIGCFIVGGVFLYLKTVRFQKREAIREAVNDPKTLRAVVLEKEDVIHFLNEKIKEIYQIKFIIEGGEVDTRGNKPPNIVIVNPQILGPHGSIFIDALKGAEKIPIVIALDDKGDSAEIRAMKLVEEIKKLVI